MGWSPQPADLEGPSCRPWRNQRPRRAHGAEPAFAALGQGEPLVMGYSIRTAEHRYTRWVEWRSHKLLAEELYDYNSISMPPLGAISLRQNLPGAILSRDGSTTAEAMD